MQQLLRILCFFLCVQCLWSQSESAAQVKLDASAKEDSLKFRNTYDQVVLEETHWQVSIPLWVPGFRGSFAFGNITIDPGFGNPAPATQVEEEDRVRQSQLSVQFYLLANLSYRTGRFFIEADGMKATLDNDISFTDGDRLKFGGTIDGVILRGFAGYRFLERTYQDTLLKWSTEAYVGVRYMDVHVFADRIDLLDVRQDWIDPIVGLRVPIVFKRWVFSVQGDYGGLTGTDHRSYFVGANGSYRFSKLFGLGLGWAYLNASYEGQYESKMLEVGMELTGPVMRMSFSF